MRTVNRPIATTSIWAAGVLAAMSLACTQPARAPLHAQVKVSQETRPDGSIAYHYRAFNFLPDRRLHSLTIGYDEESGEPQLTVYPMDFSAETAPYLEEASGLQAPAESLKSPANWLGVVMLTEETNEFEISWQSQDMAASVPPLGRRRGFSVVVPRQEAAYLSGNWRAVFDAGYVQAGRLTPDDNPSQLDADVP